MKLMILAIFITMLNVQTHGECDFDRRAVEYKSCVRLGGRCKCLVHIKECFDERLRNFDAIRKSFNEIKSNYKCVITQSYGACDLRKMTQNLPICLQFDDSCKCLNDYAACLGEYQRKFDKFRRTFNEIKSDWKCGASSLTNLGLPIMIWVALTCILQ